MLGAGRAHANPLPFPPNHEGIHVDIDETPTRGLHASFQGLFQFEGLPDEATTMSFPVPPGAVFESVEQVDAFVDWWPLVWGWSSDPGYPTILPDMPLLPLIEWTLLPEDIPFPPRTVLLGVRYNHDLLVRPGEFVFLYATGSGKYTQGYTSGIDAEFTLTHPPGYHVKSVHLDTTPHPYVVNGNTVSILVETFLSPETRDLIVIYERTVPVQSDLWMIW